MKPFSYLYNKTIGWSGHRHAPYYLAGVSFAESSFFPIPPDVMLITMGLAAPHRAWHYAFIATLFSVIGGAMGYIIGLYGMALIQPYLNASSYADNIHHIQHWFERSGVWVVILAGFSPFPYKLFTVTAGAMHMAFLPFLLGSLIGRGLRFFLVCAILYFTGAALQKHLRAYIDWIGMAVIILFIISYFLVKRIT